MMENLIICVGRQLGSGGCEIAKKLAEEFGCKYYDQELLGMAAEKSGFSRKIFETNDENHGLLKNLFNIFNVGHTGTSSYYGNQISQENLFQIQSEVIWKAAKTDSCVFVGRCADYILRKKENIFSVFITANDDERTKTVAERIGSDMDTARKYISKKETERATYYNYYTSKEWGAAKSYDLCINSSILGIDGTAQLIAQVIRQRVNDMPA